VRCCQSAEQACQRSHWPQPPRLLQQYTHSRLLQVKHSSSHTREESDMITVDCYEKCVPAGKTASRQTGACLSTPHIFQRADVLPSNNNSGLAHLASVCRRGDWHCPAAPLAPRRCCRQQALGPEAAGARAHPTRLCRALHAPAPHALLVRLALLTHSAYATGLSCNCGARVSVERLGATRLRSFQENWR